MSGLDPATAGKIDRTPTLGQLLASHRTSGDGRGDRACDGEICLPSSGAVYIVAPDQVSAADVAGPRRGPCAHRISDGAYFLAFRGARHKMDLADGNSPLTFWTAICWRVFRESDLGFGAWINSGADKSLAWTIRPSSSCSTIPRARGHFHGARPILVQPLPFLPCMFRWRRSDRRACFEAAVTSAGIRPLERFTLRAPACRCRGVIRRGRSFLCFIPTLGDT